MVREVARKEYDNGLFGRESASILYDDGLRDFGRGSVRMSRPIWVVVAWDRWAHYALADAKAHYRRLGADQVAA